MAPTEKATAVNRFTDRRRVRAIGLASAIAALGAAGGAPPAAAGGKGGDAAAEVTVRPATAERVALVRCLLPAKVDRLGSQVTRLGARREVQLTREECLARGGEVEAAGERPPHDRRER